MIYNILTSIILFLTLSGSHAQPAPVAWYFRIEKAGPHANLVCTAVIQPGWHIYSQSMTDEGPLPTSFEFEKSTEYMLEGVMIEKNQPYIFYDSLLDIEIKWLSEVVIFSQSIKLINPKAIIHGRVNYMACNNDSCLPPEQHEFSVQAR